MSVKNCIDAKGRKGIVNRELSKQAMDLFDENRARLIGRMSAADADAQAGARVIASLEAKLARGKKNTMLQARIAQNIETFMRDFRHSGGEADMGAGAMGVLNRSPWDQQQYSNVWARQQAVHHQMMAAADDLILEFRKRVGGFSRNPAGQKNIIRELHGEATGDKMAKLAADSFNKGNEIGFNRFNRAGGNIPYRKDWAMVPSHDMLTVSKAPEEEWVTFIMNLVHPAKMIDEDTGLPMTAGRLKEFLHGAYRDISTDGWATKDLSAHRAVMALANTRQHARTIHFKNADAWIEYHEKFGKAGIFDAMVGHLENLSMDVAMTEVLGPNPLAMVRYMGDLVRKNAAGKPKATAKAERTARALLLNFNELAGKNAILSTGVARGFASLKGSLDSAVLGGAAVVAVPSDLFTATMTARFNGLPATKVIHNLLRVMGGASGEEFRRLAISLGLGADHYTSMAIGQSRFAGEVLGSRLSQMVSDTVMTVTGLSPWTQSIRWAAGLTTAGELGGVLGKPFAKMNSKTVDMLKRYGITESEWLSLAGMANRDSMVGKGVLREMGGNKFLSGPAVMEFNEELGSKFLEMTASETEMAALTVTPWVRTQLRLGADPNSISGIIAKSVTAYQSWPLGIIHTHLMRGFNQSTKFEKGVYTAKLMTGLTIMGALSLQMSNITKGRDPEDMTTAKFWMRAFTKGGALGVFGDFLGTPADSFGKDVIEQRIGPIGGVVGDLFSLTKGNIEQAFGGERTNFGGESVRFAQRYMPGASIWYATLAMQRLMFNELELMINPRARDSFRRSESALHSETGQRYFWGKGDRTPVRMPDFGAAIGR